MSTVKKKNAVVKYANGKKMMRVSIDIEHRLGREFKDQMLKEGKSMASVIRPCIQAYLDAREES